MHDRASGVLGKLDRILRRLHPGQTHRSPVLFTLEIAAAFLSVLAMRDGILGKAAVPLETLLAGVLWGTLLLIACGLRSGRLDPAQRATPDM
jgi:high-affinity K+ transport system ATPase subunit B